MDRCRFEGHRQIERQCLACGSQWHVLGQRGLLGILKQARGIDLEVRRCCALRIECGARKLRSAFACASRKLRRDRLRVLGARSGSSACEARRPRRSSPEGRAKSGWDVGIRTPITASRARCPTVERRPSRREPDRLETLIIPAPERPAQLPPGGGSHKERRSHQ